MPGPAGDAANFQTIEEFWEALFTNEMIEIIVEKTNSKIEDIWFEMMENNELQQTYHVHTNCVRN